MLFQKITLTISLNPEQEADCPKSGEAELSAIEKHGDAIDRTAEPYAEGLKEALEFLGYLVEVDLSA